MPTSTPSWFRYLEIVRKISKKKEQIHSKALSDCADLEPKDASAWLCKLARWGYLRKGGQSELGGKSVFYILTDYGCTVGHPKKKRDFRKRSGFREVRKIAANPEEGLK